MADAVGLVHHQQTDGTFRQEPTSRLFQRLRRQVNQFVFSPAKALHSLATFPRIERGIDDRRPEPRLDQSVDLILHERDQRRDDQDRAAQEFGGNLKGQ
jgi:hypothetical protein